MHQRNDSGYPLAVPDLGRDLYPGEEFDHPDYVTGCTNLDAPQDQPAGDPASGGEDDAGVPPGGDGGTPDSQPHAGDDAAANAAETSKAASEENQA